MSNSDDALIWTISAAAVTTTAFVAVAVGPLVFSTGVICGVAYNALQPPDYSSAIFDELNRIGYTNEQAYAKLYPISSFFYQLLRQ